MKTTIDVSTDAITLTVHGVSMFDPLQHCYDVTLTDKSTLATITLVDIAISVYYQNTNELHFIITKSDISDRLWQHITTLLTKKSVIAYVDLFTWQVK